MTTKRTRAALRETTRRRDLAIARAFAPSFARTLRSEGRRYLEAVDGVADAGEYRTAIREVYTPARWIATVTSAWLSEPISDLYYSTIGDLGGTPTDPTIEVQRTFARFAQKHGRSIATTNRDRALAVADGSKTREFRSRMRSGLRDLYADVEGRSDHLAFVEALQAGETARYEAATSTATSERFQFRKVWFTMGDDKVRPTHQAVNGQSRVVRRRRGGSEGFFTVGGAKLRYPRDPAGPSEEIIGCRCFLEYRRVRR